MASSSFPHGLLLTATRLPNPHPFHRRQLIPRIRFPQRRRAFAPLLASPSDPTPEIASSWCPTPRDIDGCGGWSLPLVEVPKPKATPKFVIPADGIGIGISIAAVLAAASYFYFSRKGIQFHIPLPLQNIGEILQGKEPGHSPADRKTVQIEVDNAELKTNSITSNNVPSQLEDTSMPGERRHKTVTVPADSTQLESLAILKKLNIIESDVQPNDICTRREFARWLVKASVLLERNAKRKIAPSMLIAGSIITAFDDVNPGDSDFFYIQAIGEAAIIPCKLSDIADECSTSVGQKYDFAPESFLSRIDLISWKAQLEYPLNIGFEDKMLRKNVGFADLGAVTPDALQWLFMDALAGSRSITRRVFGNIRRLQPLRPVTKAQAAVAISSGRMAEAIHTELSRIEAENMARLVHKKEIESELIEKGEIQRYWEERLHEERSCGSNVQQEVSEVLEQLDEEKLIHKKEMEDHVKEKTALECQKQLLSGLKAEVDTSLQKVDSEKASIASEQQAVQALLSDLQEKQNAILDTKSILESEKEAVRILRSWVEDGARQTQFRAKVLENAVQRWKWEDQTGFSQSG